MNRATRRREEKLAGGRARLSHPPSVTQLLAEGVACHKAGRLDTAETIYERVLQDAPGHPEALHLLGLLCYRTGRLERAVALISDAIRRDPANGMYHFNLGVVSHRLGRKADAVEAYRTCLRLIPHYVEAWNNLGNTLRELGHLDEAIAAYERALERNPQYLEAHNNLGVAYKESGQLDRALAAYDTALRLSPNHAETHWNKGLVLQEQGRVDEAFASFEAAVRLRPDYAKAHHSLGLAHLWRKRPDLALPALRKSADLLHNHGRPVPQVRAHRARIKHDAEQVQYLRDRGVLGEDLEAYLEALRAQQQQMEQDPGGARYLTVEGTSAAHISPSFNRILHYAECPTLEEGALDPGLDVEAIERRYHATQPEIMYVDSLVRPEAVQALRRFCRESTIWKRDYDNGYLGAFLGEGFSCPLLLQIAEELRTRFPRIFKDHRLHQAWAFKYDSALTGLNIHADAAAVNVNFWITEDDANLDPTSGGLVVWNREAPREWNFNEYNNANNRHKIVEFLEAQGATAVTIPYRENRAVIFNSDLFHETDQLRFKSGYEHRRINITLLYGYRSRDREEDRPGTGQIAHRKSVKTDDESRA